VSALRGRAVTQAYVDTNALERDCPNCAVVVGEFCVFDDGSERHVPCIARVTR
jgi:hypothetical protein